MQISKTLMAGMLAVIPTFGHAGYANAVSVTASGDGSFTVQSNVGSDTSVYWCGAAEYVDRQRQGARQGRIYVLAANSQGVRFALTPPAEGAVSSITNSVRMTGNSLSVVQARQHCYDKNITE